MFNAWACYYVVHGQQPQQPTPVSAPVAQRVQSTPPQPSPRSQTRKYDS